MNPGTIGLIGGVGGTVIGIMGGVIGSYFSIKNTTTPAERSLMVRFVIALWTAVVVLIGVPLALSIAGIIPRWTYWACFALFFVVLGPAIWWVNRRQAERPKEARPTTQEGAGCEGADNLRQ